MNQTINIFVHGYYDLEYEVTLRVNFGVDEHPVWY